MKPNNYSKNKLPHQFYNLKKLITNPVLYAVVLVLSFLLTSNMVYAQGTDKPFTLRTSQQAPANFAGKQIYTLKGDFTMIGNANVANAKKKTFSDWATHAPEDVLSSSSADFNLPSTINNPCTKIIFAGLYWTSGITGGINGKDDKFIKFKTPGMNAYKDLSTTDDVFFDTDLNLVFTGYCDVTNLVRAGGVGTYSVANIGVNNQALTYARGWSLVIIYENATLPLKNIGVFDGYSYLGFFNNSKQIDLNGFRTTQSGHVNIKMGLMASALNGNQGKSFQIKKRNTNDWYSLSHSLNTINDFFNGSILTGGNTRIPNNTDNMIDIVVFDVPNENNQILDNNQTSTSFLAKDSNLDNYYLYNVTFAFDAYAPEIVALNKSNNNLQNNASVSPGQELEFEIDLYNKGNEALKNTAVEITLPTNVTFVSSEYTKGGNVILSPPDISTLATNGKVKWNIGNIELPRVATTIIGKLKYKVKVTDDCLLLTKGITNCSKTTAINGKITGTGAVSGADFNNNLAIGFTSGACVESPIYDAFNLNVNVSDAFIASCPAAAIYKTKIFTGCATNFPYANIASSYPAGTKFYGTIPSTWGYETSIINDIFSIDPSGKPTIYYAIVPGAASNCFLNLQTQLGSCAMMTNPMIPTKFKTQ
ncbi:DUF11 domain-containing protein [Pedobacter nototheniae]|uniref:DUF11 domain-containing protein n=1 Tax=Pedobacter nototheniae TaxID=2488994 RepID=UPI00103B502D|nr:DUF11 domain-containing protein [Pedobacter nototheniae]